MDTRAASDHLPHFGRPKAGALLESTLLFQGSPHPPSLKRSCPGRACLGVATLPSAARLALYLLLVTEDFGWFTLPCQHGSVSGLIIHSAAHFPSASSSLNLTPLQQFPGLWPAMLCPHMDLDSLRSSSWFSVTKHSSFKPTFHYALSMLNCPRHQDLQLPSYVTKFSALCPQISDEELVTLSSILIISPVYDL